MRIQKWNENWKFWADKDSFALVWNVPESKGGNLAIYSAVKSEDDIKERIIDVYNNDGPGFDKNMIESNEYRQMLPKIKTIVPYHSFVGMLLEHEEDYKVVKSNQKGIMQHDAMSWQIMGNAFQTHCKVMIKK